nr:MAG TPA: hypothetical protein [Caudoviricetes sp.]
MNCVPVHHGTYGKIVERCEPFLRVSFGVVQRVSSVQLVAPNWYRRSGYGRCR